MYVSFLSPLVLSVHLTYQLSFLLNSRIRLRDVLEEALLGSSHWQGDAPGTIKSRNSEYAMYSGLSLFRFT